MWICGKCRNENADAATHCWMCGEAKGYQDAPLLLTAKDLVTPRRTAHVPRRFGIGTMMVITACFAVFFSILKVAGAPWQVYLFIPLFVVGAGLGQVLLFRGRRPRTASVLAGIILGGVLSFVGAVIEGINSESNNGLPVSYFIEHWAISMLCPGLFLCSILGYLSGLVASALFLFCERKEQAEEDKAEEERRLASSRKRIGS